jgi:hypothetical protein
MRITDFPELIAPTGNDLLVTVDIANDLTKKVKLDNLPISLPALTALATKQDSLVSGTNIKTVNSNSLLGSGDVAVQETLVSGTNIKTLNNTSLLGSGNIVLTANPSGVAGAIQFSNGSAFASDATNFFWDDTNNRLGVGTNAPINNLTIIDSTSGSTSGAKGITVGNSHTANALSFGSYFNVGVISGPTGPLMLQTPAGNKGVSISTGYLIPTAMAHIQGSGATSATTSLLVQNSAGTQLMKMGDAGYFFAGNSSANTYIINDPSDAGYFATQGPIFLQNGGTTSVAIIGQRMSIGKGTSYADASATLELSSTTRGFLPPRMTTTQKNAIASPASGLVVYDSTTNKLCCYNGSTWNDLF